MTVVEATLRRSLNYSSFVDITGPDIELLRWTKTRAEFDGDLTPEQVQAVWARMESTDDVDQAARADLRASRDAATGDDPLAVAVRASINYQLGETP